VRDGTTVPKTNAQGRFQGKPQFNSNNGARNVVGNKLIKPSLTIMCVRKRTTTTRAMFCIDTSVLVFYQPRIQYSQGVSFFDQNYLDIIDSLCSVPDGPETTVADVHNFDSFKNVDFIHNCVKGQFVNPFHKPAASGVPFAIQAHGTWASDLLWAYIDARDITVPRFFSSVFARM
jgi:hypothetical protein